MKAIVPFVMLVVLLSFALIVWRSSPDEFRQPVKDFIYRHWFVPVIVLIVLAGIAVGLSAFSIKLF